MKKMLLPYKMTWRFITRNMAFFLTLVALMLSLQVFGQYFSVGLGAKFIPYLMIFFVMYRAMMFGETYYRMPEGGPARPVRIGRFLLTCTGIFGVLMIATLIVFLAYDGSTGFQSTTETRLVPLTITMVLCGFFIIGLLGTALPAAVAVDKTDFGTRVLNSARSAPRVMIGLLIGPALYYAVFFIAIAAIGSQIDLSQPYYEADTGLSVLQILSGFPITAFSMAGSFLAISVLIEAYRHTAPDDIASVMTPAA